MSAFDESKPYGTIHGMCGMQGYEQDGQRYDRNKQLVGAEPVPAVDPAEPEALADLHWRELKKLVEARGGEWIDKAAALEFLK